MPSAPATATKPRWWRFPSSFHPTAARSAFWSRKSCESSTTLLGDPQHPYVAVMGGAKVSDKISVIESLIKKVDRLLIGGAMTYTFMKAQGKPVGKSKVEADKLDVASQLLHLAGEKLVLPKDHLVASKPEAGAETKVVDGAEIPDGWFGMDIGPATIAEYAAIIKQAGTVVWNGPMGKFEVEAFAQGTKAIALALASVAGDHRRGRRRIGRGHREIRPGRPGQSRLDRRRCLPRSARGEVVQLPQCYPGQCVSPSGLTINLKHEPACLLEQAAFLLASGYHDRSN